ncbi:MAG TPA: hypothetical protein VFA90_17210 [Terriglobales bacterium]|jgi:hypothetical protein|nr:hypothetical protein [Terriglobales bacterium]
MHIPNSGLAELWADDWFHIFMGADLFIKARFDRTFNSDMPSPEKSVQSKAPSSAPCGMHALQPTARPNEPVFSEAYFRDSYNLTSVLWTLGLSWWQDVLPLLDERNELKGQKLKGFRDQVAGARQHLPTAEEFREQNWKGSSISSLAELHVYYMKKRKGLLAFLDLAIEKGLPVQCSL